MQIEPKNILIGIGATLFISLIIWATMDSRDQALHNQAQVIATVLNLERRCETTTDSHTDSEGRTTYSTDVECIDYVHTDQETFKNVPEMWVSKGSGDVIRIQGTLERGKKYTFTVSGRSNPNLGVFRNIHKFEPPQESW
jgi:hypothetical protein